MPLELRVLLIEDCPADANAVRRSLAASTAARFDLRFAPSLREARPHLAQGGWDALLLDLTLPDVPALDALLAVRRALPQTPVVTLGYLHDGPPEQAVLAAGAGDYVVKGRELSELGRLVRRAVWRHGSSLLRQPV